MKKIILILTALLLVAPFAMAQSDILAVDLAEDHIDITTGFNGVNLILFGVKDSIGDIAVTISSPEDETIVRRKENVVGMWMNRSAAHFENVPVYYSFSTSRPIEEIAKETTLNEHRIGLQSLRFTPLESVENTKDFQDALIRNKQTQGLFPSQAGEIEFINDKFFRTSFYVPANAPTGTYTIKTFLFKNGNILDIKTTDVRVAQVGKGAAIQNFSRSWSFAYGLLCVLFGMSAGWLSNMIRNRLR